MNKQILIGLLLHLSWITYWWQVLIDAGEISNDACWWLIDCNTWSQPKHHELSFDILKIKND